MARYARQMRITPNIFIHASMNKYICRYTRLALPYRTLYYETQKYTRDNPEKYLNLVYFHFSTQDIVYLCKRSLVYKK